MLFVGFFKYAGGMLYSYHNEGVMHMSQYILPDVLMAKSEELLDIINTMCEIAQATGEAADNLMKMSEFDDCIRALEVVCEAIYTNSNQVIQLSEALSEIVIITQRAENEITDRIREGEFRKVSYARTSSLNRIDPATVDIF